MKKAAILICIVIGFITYNCFDLSAKFKQEPCKILFIGSSNYAFSSPPNIFQSLAITAGKDIYIHQYTPGSTFLADHANSDETALEIKRERWDYVFLGGIGSPIAYPNRYSDRPVYSSIVKLKEKILKNCETTKMFYCLPWALENGGTNDEGGKDTYEEMQLRIYNNTIKYSEDIGFPIAPIGWAWNKVLEEMGYPAHYLHIHDGNHPSIRGGYLAACVLYATVFQESVEGLSFYGGMEKTEATYLQSIGSNIVLDNLDLWKIPKLILGIEELPESNGFNLSQNYPNPFGSNTVITFEILKGTKVEISIYDMYGNQYSKLVNEYKQKGKHSVNFDGSQLPKGVYFYTINIGKNFITKKMTRIE